MEQLDLLPIELEGVSQERPLIIAGPLQCRNRRTSYDYSQVTV